MKLITLIAENFKRLRAVIINPDGSLYIIGGKNKQGKTSTLDAIEVALGGGTAIPAEPIRKGASRARVVLDLGDIKVTRKFTRKGSTLEVRAADGEKYSSPQAMLDSLVGRLSFDPLAFVHMGQAKQAQTLRELAGLDFAKLDLKRADAYERRRLANSDIKRAQAQVDLSTFHDDAPAEEVSVAELALEKDRRVHHNNNNEQVQTHAEGAEDDMSRCTRNLKESTDALDDAKKGVLADKEALGASIKSLVAAKAEVAKLIDQDVAEIHQQILEADANNDRVRANRDYAKATTDYKLAVESREHWQTRITGVDEKKLAMLEEATYPVPGLSVEEDEVRLNGVPFLQASGAEQLQCSVAIGLALNPKLRLILIRDGSRLDKDGLEIIAKMAAEADAQVIMERVGDGEEVHVVIEDGMVQGAEPQTPMDDIPDVHPSHLDWTAEEEAEIAKAGNDKKPASRKQTQGELTITKTSNKGGAS